MTSYISSLNIAIKSRKQPSNPVTVKDRRTYWKRITANIPNQKGGNTSKAVTTTLKQANNHS